MSQGFFCTFAYMATVFEPFINNLISAETNLVSIAKEIIKDNSSTIVLMVKGQLSSGTNSKGNVLKWKNGSGGNGYYAPDTHKFAKAQGVRMPKVHGQRYNFSWTGETLDNLEMGKIKEDFYEITTVRFKKALLESIYGDIFSLTPQNNHIINKDIIFPNLELYILKKTFSL